MKEKTVVVILAGGRGSRLGPLTRDRAKPAVPFGGAYRIIDFSLSNCVNSGFRHILLLTQYKAFSLDRHISLGWSRFFCRELGEFIDILPPQQRIDDSWYRGTADAVYQNIYSIEKERPKYVVILAGDHIYKMNYGKLIDFHRRRNADLTISALPLPIETVRRRFGVLETDAKGQLTGFEEKPENPQPIPKMESLALASMGIYVFSARFLFEELCRDATATNSNHDFGRDIIPRATRLNRVFAFPFWEEKSRTPGYWRDVGTIQAYYDANMDLINVAPELNIYDQNWSIYTHQPHDPPPKFVFSEERRKGTALESLVCPGTIISGGSAFRSILGPRVRINSFASVRDSILFSDVNIGRNAQIQKTIIEKGIDIPDGWTIGFDHALDRSRGFYVTEEGLTVVSRIVSSSPVSQGQ